MNEKLGEHFRVNNKWGGLLNNLGGRLINTQIKMG